MADPALRAGRVLLLTLRTLLVLVALVLCAVHARGCAAPPQDDAARIAEVRAQLAFVGRAIREERALERMQHLFPEGAAFLATLYGLAWANVGRAARDAAARDEAISGIEFALDRVASPVAVRPFHDTQIEHGVFWAGQRNLLLGELLDLSPEAQRPPGLIAEFHARSASLAAAFVTSPTRHLDAYRNGCWPADQVTALASLAIHDRLYGTNHLRAARAWADWTLEHLDPVTRLPHGQIDSRSGLPREVTRGCGTSWILALLPRIDPALSRTFWDRYVAAMGRPRLGFATFAEWPAGVERPSDGDSGPVVWGAGTVATAVALAAARANGDAATAADVYALAQLCGLPSTSNAGAEKSYLRGALPVGDAFLAFGLSTPLPPGAHEDDRGALGRLADRWPFHAIVAAVQAALAFLALRVLRTRARVRAAEPAPPHAPAPSRADAAT